MYTILVTEANELVTTLKERIMRRSKLVDTLHFLVDSEYKGQDMSQFIVTMEYRLPISGDYKAEILTLSEEPYKDMLEYKVPFDTCLTKEHGDIEVQLTFSHVEMNPEGKITQRVRKTSPTIITIVPIAAWSNMIPDANLTDLDQRLVKLEAQANALDEFTQAMYETKADDISYEDSQLQLLANGNKIGKQVTITSSSSDINGVPIITFGTNQKQENLNGTTSESPDSSSGYDVVLF